MLFGLDLSYEDLEKLKVTAAKWGYKSTKEFIQDVLVQAMDAEPEMSRRLGEPIKPLPKTLTIKLGDGISN